MPERPLQYRVEADRGWFIVRCEVLAIALREAEMMARMIGSDVHVYHGEQLVQTINPQRPS
jgi:hypothetical protein